MNDLMDSLGATHPIMGFTPTPAVAVEISKAGGIGVLGAQRMDEAEFAKALAWMDAELGDIPYGVDLQLYSGPVSGNLDAGLDELEAGIPSTHRDYIDGLRRRFSLPAGAEPKNSASRANAERTIARVPTSPRLAELTETVRRHRPRLVVSALGPFPAELADSFHDLGMTLGGVVGAPEHVRYHLRAGVDLIVAQGSEAAGHTGEISTMALIPQVVAVSGAVPVVAAGGIATGQQVLAAQALGAAAVWLGSLWLTTTESDIHPIVKRKLLGARSSDAVQTSWWTGKPVRMLKTPLTDAWAEPETPEPLPAFMHRLLVSPLWIDAYAAEDETLMGELIGQAVGLMNEPESVGEAMRRLMREYAAAADRMAALAGTDRELKGSIA